MVRKLQQVVILALGASVALLLAAYAAVQDYFFPSSRVAQSDACEDATVQDAPKKNPNKMLFISCGGFLE